MYVKHNKNDDKKKHNKNALCKRIYNTIYVNLTNITNI